MHKGRKILGILAVGFALFAVLYGFWWGSQAFRISAESKTLTAAIEQSGLSGKGVGIAIIDSGVDKGLTLFTQTAFGQGWNTYDNNAVTEDFTGHGSNVAGLVAGNGARGCSKGIAPNVTLYVYKSGNDQHYQDSEKRAIERAVNNTDVDIILITVGGGRRGMNASVLSALISAVNKDKIIVTVSGNGGKNTPVQPSALAGITNAKGLHHIIVGSTVNGKKAKYSHGFGGLAQYGVMVSGEVMVPTLFPWCLPARGTSFSAPRVAGIISLLIEAHPNIEREIILQALLEGANSLSIERTSEDTGRGMVDLSRTLLLLKNQ